jgi:uncharacterized protein (TIGR00251 family)
VAGRIFVTVKPNARKTSVTPVSDREYQVAVQVPARQGKANEAVIETLAAYFSVPKSRIKIVRGGSGRKKLIAIE